MPQDAARMAARTWFVTVATVATTLSAASATGGHATDGVVGPATWEQNSPFRAPKWKIDFPKFYELRDRAAALSAHRICTADEELCTKQDRVVVLLLCRARADPVAKQFDDIRKRFQKGSIAMFVSWKEEVHDTFFGETLGRNPTIVVINPFDKFGRKLAGVPTVTSMPSSVKFSDYEAVIEWIIRQTLAHVESWPGDFGRGESALGRMVLFKSVSWPKAIIYTTSTDVEEDVMDAVEEHMPLFAVAVYHVNKKSDLGFEFPESRHDQIWSSLSDTAYKQNAFVSLSHPRTKHSMKVATTISKLPVVFDQFMADTNRKLKSASEGNAESKKEGKRGKSKKKKSSGKQKKHKLDSVNTESSGHNDEKKKSQESTASYPVEEIIEINADEDNDHTEL